MKDSRFPLISKMPSHSDVSFKDEMKDRQAEQEILYPKHKKVKKYYAVDLDGTLAHYEGWSPEIGKPIPKMIKRVKKWLEEGKEVRIFTARVSRFHDTTNEEVAAIRLKIQKWCVEHLGKQLEVTNIKEHGLVELWDDRAVQVIPNTGKRVKWLKSKKRK